MDFGKWKLVIAAVEFVVVFGLMWGMTFALGEPSPVMALAVAGIAVASTWIGLHAVGRSLMMAPFVAKGRVLRDAGLRVDRVEPLPAPSWMADLPPDADDEDDLPPRIYYRIEVTVDPKPADGAFQHWDPYDLSCVPEGFRPTWKTLSESDEEPGFELENLALWTGTEFSEDDVDKVTGRQRLGFSVGVPEGTRALAMLYYFETFGRISLPEHRR